MAIASLQADGPCDMHLARQPVFARILRSEAQRVCLVISRGDRGGASEPSTDRLDANPHAQEKHLNKQW